MSRTIRGDKGSRDYWTPRYDNDSWGNGPAKGVKRRTNRAERRIAKRLLEKLQDVKFSPRRPHDGV